MQAFRGRRLTKVGSAFLLSEVPPSPSRSFTSDLIKLSRNPVSSTTTNIISIAQHVVRVLVLSTRVWVWERGNSSSNVQSSSESSNSQAAPDYPQSCQASSSLNHSMVVPISNLWIFCCESLAGRCLLSQPASGTGGWECQHCTLPWPYLIARVTGVVGILLYSCTLHRLAVNTGNFFIVHTWSLQFCLLF